MISSSSGVNAPASESISSAGSPLISSADWMSASFSYGSIPAAHPDGAINSISIGIWIISPALSVSMVISVALPEVALASANSAPHPSFIFTVEVWLKDSIPHGNKSLITTSVASIDPWFSTLIKKTIVSPTAKVPDAGTLLGSTVLLRAKSNIGKVAGSLSSSSLKGS